MSQAIPAHVLLALADFDAGRLDAIILGGRSQLDTTGQD